PGGGRAGDNLSHLHRNPLCKRRFGRRPDGDRCCRTSAHALLGRHAGRPIDHPDFIRLFLGGGRWALSFCRALSRTPAREGGRDQQNELDQDLKLRDASGKCAGATRLRAVDVAGLERPETVSQFSVAANVRSIRSTLRSSARSSPANPPRAFSFSNSASFSPACPCVTRTVASTTVFFPFGSFGSRNIATSHFNYSGCFTMARPSSLRPEAIRVGEWSWRRSAPPNIMLFHAQPTMTEADFDAP